MATVKTDKKQHHGFTLTLTGVGTVSISKEGTFESNNTSGIEKLLTRKKDFYLVDEKGDRIGEIPEELKEDSKEENIQSKSEEDNLNKKQEDIQLSAEEKADLIESFNDLTKAELQGNCKPFPRKEWGDLNKGELIAYLKEKIG